MDYTCTVVIQPLCQVVSPAVCEGLPVSVSLPGASGVIEAVEQIMYITQ